MQRLKFVLIGMFGAMLLVGATVTASIAAETKAAPAQHKKNAVVNKARVVVQVSDDSPKTWNQALNVVKNIQQAYGKDKVQVEVVAFGNGIGMLKMDSEVGNRIEDTLQSGAHVFACQNTMRARKLSKDDMLAKIAYVPAGVIEIINRQKQGWSVIRP
jgi:intracellular sulfur oxidation DsrE/DsrF family protein